MPAEGSDWQTSCELSPPSSSRWTCIFISFPDSCEQILMCVSTRKAKKRMNMVATGRGKGSPWSGNFALSQRKVTYLK